MNNSTPMDSLGRLVSTPEKHSVNCMEMATFLDFWVILGVNLDGLVTIAVIDLMRLMLLRMERDLVLQESYHLL